MSVPVTILCGELGAGKTTLLSELLETSERDIAVLVNDVGAVNVDADLVEARTDLTTGEEVLALENGCICCSLGGELSRSVIQLWKEHDFEYLIVEASGIGEPEPIARQFVRGPAGGPYDLDAVITVVDARRFYDRFGDSAADEPPTRQGPDKTGSRPLADLLLEQVEFCDLLVVNKCDLVSTAERERVVALLETLQPRAEVVTTEYGDVDPETLLDSKRFDLEAATESAGWKQLLEDETEHEESNAAAHDHDHDHDHDHEHSHPSERYGIAVDTYHRQRPFHPERFVALLADLPDGLVRAKGLCWVANRERQAITMSYAGTETTLEVTGRWIASLSDERQAAFRDSQPDLTWDEEWGDRETRLALIGRNLAMDDLQARLDHCLLTDDELDADWSTFENPAPTGMGDMTTVVSDEQP
ncbi:CobW family GTP-binding protein [Natronorubrum bangense]|uniref:Cobalamin synthesis protein P47K n=2 Tax=Natronorubrum bangense TaxID=61858 RepID=L9WN38_9EURY|nr:GTP-binding protein [Natronorubrum bangense]ELY50626.1 cobalamin synthesis protein P47K [Natronorubrum bangense JCM 10635]QCC54474.1 GTP-binding protein [Natronorubrum bangense]